VVDPGFLIGGWLINIRAIGEKITSAIALFPFLNLSLNDPEEGVG